MTSTEKNPAALQGSQGDATEQQWEAAAAAVLRKSGKLGADDPESVVWQRLARRTVEGIEIPPLGTVARSATGLPIDRPAGAWDIRSAIEVTDAAAATNEQVLTELMGGASSVWLAITGPGTDLAAVLDEVRLDLAPVVIQVHAGSALETARGLAALLEPVADRHPAHQLGIDPLGDQLRGGDQADLASVVQAAGLAAPLGIRGLVADGTAAHEAGAADAAELGWALAAGVCYLRLLADAGFEPGDAAGLLEFRYAVTDEQFTTIAKLRAARQLWTRVLQLSDVTEPTKPQLLHAVTSRPMLTRYDSYTNLLRTTVAAFAAGVGGADSITVLPFDSALGRPEALGYRMARNISHLLIEESHVAVTADPAAGSHAVELLTARLAEAAWAEFERIEASGGAAAALIDGSVNERWAQTAAQRERLIATRRQPITGVTEFPAGGEALPVREPSAQPTVRAWADSFQNLRDQPAPVPLFLATLGPVAAHTARATFAANLFAAGGIELVTAGPTDTAAAVLDRYRSSGAPVVCLAGGDTSYEDWAAELVPALRAAGATRILLAGKPSETVGALIDDHVAVGHDVLAFLHRTREALAATMADHDITTGVGSGAEEETV